MSSALASSNGRPKSNWVQPTTEGRKIAGKMEKARIGTPLFPCLSAGAAR
jgi:hypothetical protein